MKERIITASALITVFIISMIIGPKAAFCLALSFLIVSSYEIYRLRRGSIAPIMIVIYALSIILMTFLPIDYHPVFNAGLIIVLFTISMFFGWYDIENISFDFFILSFMGLIGAIIKSILFRDLKILIYILIAAFATDTGAYFIGRKFGRNKLIERVSPNKTIEGAVGGYLLGAVLSFVFAYFFLQSSINLTLLLITSLLIPVFSQIGDLSFSLIKRHYKIKDFGFIFPGHGGVLDRIDSLSFSILVFYIVSQILT